MKEKVMIEDDKRVLTNRPKEKSSEVTKISTKQLETLGQMINANHEMNSNDIEIIILKLKNEQLRNDLKREKEFLKSFNKPNEDIEYFEKLMKSPRSNNYTSRLGYTKLKKENHPKMLKKEVTMVRTQNLLFIIVVRKDILLMCTRGRL